MSIVCAAKNCKYSSENEDLTHVIFINFPNDDTSKIWAHHCGRTDLLTKTNEELHLNYYICSHHIEDRYYISKMDPIIINQHAVPTLFDSDVIAKKDTTDMFDRNEQAEVTDSVVLTYCDVDAEIDHYGGISIRFPNLCRICGEPSLDAIEIFAEKGMELKVNEKIHLHLPINVEMEDLMPQKLCINCYNRLEIAHSLVVTSLRTDMRLRRFLSINEELNYDSKYNELAKKCSAEIAEEMCSSEITQSTSMELPSSKVEGTIMNQIQKDDTDKNTFESNVRKEMQSELNSFIESYGEEDNDNPSNETATNDSNKDIVNDYNEIVCFHCKDSFRTQEMFQNHKMLCDEEEIIVEKEKESDNNVSSKESGTIELINFELATKTCDICQKRFTSEKHLTEHKLSHCKFSEGSCQIPDKLSAIENERNVHKSTPNTDMIVFMKTNKKCGHCDTIYSTKRQLLSHIAKCHGGQSLFKCIACNRSFEKWSSLDVHIATHRVDNPYLCDLCGKSFKHSNNLRGHKRIHLDDAKKNRYVCEICRKAFRSRFHLGEHMNQHNGNKPYSCEKCGKTFYKRIQLRQHRLCHGVNKHVCPVCGAAFNRKGNMNAHLKRHNNEDGTYACSVCAYRCKSMSELKLHRKEHTEEDIAESIKKKCIDKTIWHCKYCSRIFPSRATLVCHERAHKEEKISVECNICGKELASKHSLLHHKKSVHSTERPEMCHFCGDSFVSKETRLIHERVHTGERPYVCEICKMEYKYSSNLYQHMKIHSGIKPHKCKYCGKDFARKGTLNVHERIHTGEKPYPCETCGRTFSQKNDMLKHTKTHKAKSLQCDQCDEIFTKKKDIVKHITSHEQINPVAQFVEIQPYNVNLSCSKF